MKIRVKIRAEVLMAVKMPMFGWVMTPRRLAGSY
jgi:hypothetical protein